MTGKRSYTLRERAKSQDETRLRIVEATMHLHEEVGARATTISAIAERAGVQRLTVYRHFPDETAVFQACTAHWLTLNPPPEAAAWQHLAAPRQRAAAALAAFFAYYGHTRRMWASSHRDVDKVPALQDPMAAFSAHVAGIADALAAGFGATGPASARMQATLRHALTYPLWEALEGQQLDDEEKLALALAWLDGAAGS